MNNSVISYTTDAIMISIALFTNKIVLAVSSVSYLSPEVKEILIESKEVIGLVVVILTAVKLFFDIKNRAKK
jgi:hypothetical protein